MSNVYKTKRSLRVSNLGPESKLPRFSGMGNPAPLVYADDLPPEAVQDKITSATPRCFPYRVQNKYDRVQRPTEIDAACIENDQLRIVCYPTWGGRMVSLYDKTHDRELLFDNPVFQPANLGICDAWFSGGVEWNGPVFGHSPQACRPVYAARVETAAGPLLRLYEFDRILETTWQVDLFLPEHSGDLWVHVKIRNLCPQPVDYYWWSNIAVPLGQRTRVLAEQTRAVSHSMDHQIRNVAFPRQNNGDISYPRILEEADSIFFLNHGGGRPWIAYADSDGNGLLHCSTQALSGRKFWCYGSLPGAQHWLDFLSAKDQGNYIEIQAGITPTQTQRRTIESNASIEWTECYAPLRLDAAEAHDENYSTACAAAKCFMNEHIPDAALQETHALLTDHADQSPAELLFHGAGWGRLHEQVSSQRIQGLVFETYPGDDERPWRELIEEGFFSEETLKADPESWCLSEAWMQRLETSMQTHGETWLHHLLMAAALLEHGKVDDAAAHAERSWELKHNFQAARILGLIHANHARWEEAYASYMQAWELSNDPDLAIEVAHFLKAHQSTERFQDFVDALSEEHRQLERIQLAVAEVALKAGHPEKTLEILNQEFINIAEGENILGDLWFASWIRLKENSVGRALTQAEEQAARKQHPVPIEIDFRFAAD